MTGPDDIITEVSELGDLADRLRPVHTVLVDNRFEPVAAELERIIAALADGATHADVKRALAWRQQVAIVQASWDADADKVATMGHGARYAAARLAAAVEADALRREGLWTVRHCREVTGRGRQCANKALPTIERPACWSHATPVERLADAIRGEFVTPPDYGVYAGDAVMPAHVGADEYPIRETLATWSSECRVCGEWIEVDTLIVLTPRWKWIHAKCWPGALVNDRLRGPLPDPEDDI